MALGPQTRSEGARRPRRLLSGLVNCGLAAPPMIIGGAQGRLVCSNRRERGASVCAEGRSVRSGLIEERVTAAIKGLLLDPGAVMAAVGEYQAMSGDRRKRLRTERQAGEKELEEVKRRASRLVDQVADGLISGAAVSDKLMQLEQRRSEIEQKLKAIDPARDRSASLSAGPLPPAGRATGRSSGQARDSGGRRRPRCVPRPDQLGRGDDRGGEGDVRPEGRD